MHHTLDDVVDMHPVFDESISNISDLSLNLQEVKDSLLGLLLSAVTFCQSQKVQGPELCIFK
jgi:hypothetical protein